jgi:hypothetical protein
MVTAEAALALPIVAMFALVLVWLVAVGIDQVRVVDAARDAARQVARGDADGDARQAALRTAPDGSTVEFSRADGLVTVAVSHTAVPPRWLLVPLPELTVSADATVEVEPDAELP